MTKKYEGKNICCTCAYKCIRKNEDCDPCDICYSRDEQYVESRLNCSECRDKNCEFR